MNFDEVIKIMVKKLSETKVSKIFILYFQGYSQTEIGNKLKVDQSTVSLHVSKFKALAEQQGIMAAAEEYGVMDEVQVLYDLGVELKKAKLTVEEAKAGLEMELLFQNYGVKQEEYGNLIQTCKNIQKEGCLAAAMELNQLESGTGFSYKELVTEYKGFDDQLIQTQKELEGTKANIKASNMELAEINGQKKQATQDLKAHMKKIGADEQRLKAIEVLALTLKKAGAFNQELWEYIGRQELLNKTGISINVLTDILEKSKVAVSGDNGKQLINMLNEYGNLSAVINKLEVKKKLLVDEVGNLQPLAKLKGKLEMEVKKLETDKAGLEANIAQLQNQKEELANKIEKQKNDLNLQAAQYYAVQNSYQELTKTKTQLEQEITAMQAARDSLYNENTLLNQKVSNLKEKALKSEQYIAELESKNGQLVKENAELDAKRNREKKRLKIFEGFLGFMQSTSLEELRKNAKVLPDFLMETQQDKYPTEFLKNFILENLAGPELQVLRCDTCNVQFVVNKIAQQGISYRCPVGDMSHKVVIDKNALELLQKALSEAKPKRIITTVTSSQIQLGTKDKGKM